MFSAFNACMSRPSDVIEPGVSEPRGPASTRKIDDPIEDGDSIIITGIVSDRTDCIEIAFYLDNSKEDIALHLNVDYCSNTMKLNSRIKGNWGKEETTISRDHNLIGETDFVCQLLFTKHIAIAFDYKHLVNYKHRLPYKLIRRVEVRGEISSALIERKSLAVYPQQRKHLALLPYTSETNPDTPEHDDMELGAVGGEPERKFLSLPHQASISTSFLEVGHGIIISGKVRRSPQMLKVALKVGCMATPPPIIAMQLEARFNEKRDVGTDEPVIVFNSFSNDKWTGEVQCELENGLQPGGNFQLRIVRGARSFQIYMNNRHIHNYPYIVSAGDVDTCCIDGDIRLIAVDSENEHVRDD